ncbi:MAG: hypothetical protein V3V00_15685 [Saprospiraceae bacterium]
MKLPAYKGKVVKVKNIELYFKCMNCAHIERIDYPSEIHSKDYSEDGFPFADDHKKFISHHCDKNDKTKVGIAYLIRVVEK